MKWAVCGALANICAGSCLSGCDSAHHFRTGFLARVWGWLGWLSVQRRGGRSNQLCVLCVGRCSTVPSFESLFHSIFGATVRSGTLVFGVYVCVCVCCVVCGCACLSRRFAIVRCAGGTHAVRTHARTQGVIKRVESGNNNMRWPCSSSAVRRPAYARTVGCGSAGRECVRMDYYYIYMRDSETIYTFASGICI